MQTHEHGKVLVKQLGVHTVSYGEGLGDRREKVGRAQRVERGWATCAMDPDFILQPQQQEWRLEKGSYSDLMILVF